MDWSTIFTALTALAALVAVGASFITIRQQARTMKQEADLAAFTAGITILVSYEEKFFSDAMCIHRQQAAHILLSKSQQLTQEGRQRDIDAVLNFLENIGLFLRRQVFEVDLAYSMFARWVKGYWLACEPRIEYVRRRYADPNKWADLQFLYEKLIAFEAEQEIFGSRKEAQAEFIQHFCTMKRLPLMIPTSITKTNLYRRIHSVGQTLKQTILDSQARNLWWIRRNVEGNKPAQKPTS